jgi:hypothetical protein
MTEKYTESELLLGSSPDTKESLTHGTFDIEAQTGAAEGLVSMLLRSESRTVKFIGCTSYLVALALWLYCFWQIVSADEPSLVWMIVVSACIASRYKAGREP